MWTTVNQVDLTDAIDPDSFEVTSTLSDPLPRCKFKIDDPGCLINLDTQQEIIVWDETGGTNMVPAINLILNPFIYTLGAGSNWTASGPNSGLILSASPSNYSATATLANAPLGLGQQQQQTLLGDILPGITYCFSWRSKITTTFVGAVAFAGIDFLDSSGAVISGASSTTNYTTTGGVETRQSITTTAPSNAAFALVRWGINVTSATNSGAIQWGFGTTLKTQFMLEPCMFVKKGVAYPTYDCSFIIIENSLCVGMPDGTASRRCRVFTGYIDDLIATYNGNNRVWEVQCAGTGAILENVNLLNINVADGTYDDTIINNIVSTSYQGLLSTSAMWTSAPPTTVQRGIQVASESYADQTFRDILNSLADQSGYIFYVDPYFYLHYSPLYWDVAAVEISVDNPDYVKTFPPVEYSIERDGTALKNRVKVTGASQVYPTQTDVWSGDGTKKTFPLTYSPKTLGSCSVGKVGVSGVNTFSQGYAALVDKGALQLICQNAPASGSNNVNLSYTFEAPVAASVQSLDSYARFRGYYDSKVNDTSLTSVAAAISRGLAELTKNAFPKVVISFKTDQIFTPGQIIFFTSSHDGYTREPFVCQEVTGHVLGGGENEYEVKCGAYVPTLIDVLRNTQKAVNKAQTTANTNAPVQIDLVTSDTIKYSDSISATTQTAPPAAVYGSAIYGFSSFQ
jgi:hypothetical protein